MNTSISLLLSDILPHRKRAYHKVVTNKIFKDKKTDEIFTELKKLGLDGFELLLPQYANITNKDILEIEELTKRNKFPVLSVHQSLRFLTTTKVKEITRLFEIAHMLRAKVIVLHINSAKKQIFDEKYVQTLHELEKKYAVIVTFENMEKHAQSYFYSHRWHPTKFAALVANTNFHITYDVQHLAHSGGYILGFYSENEKRIINIHLSDYRFHPFNSSIRPLRYKHMPLGKGELPITEFLNLLVKEKYNGLLTLELHADMKGVEQSMAIINQSISTHSTKN